MHRANSCQLVEYHQIAAALTHSQTPVQSHYQKRKRPFSMCPPAGSDRFPLRCISAVSFRQRCVAVVNRTDGWSVPDVFGKQGVHVVADAVSEVVAAGTYPIQAVDQAVAVVGG